jgi:hypothetical protein
VDSEVKNIIISVSSSGISALTPSEDIRRVAMIGEAGPKEGESLQPM